MILGIGTDIVLIARIRKLSAPTLARLLTPRERKYCTRYRDSAAREAGRFAAKEALLKAMGTGLSGGISWHQMEILPDAKGMPHVAFSGAAKKKCAALGATHCHLSISHQGDYALAFAVLESGTRS